MKILLLSDVYFPRVNGVSTSIRTFAESLARMGHSVTIVAPDHGSAGRQAAHDGGDAYEVIRLASRKVLFDPEDRLITGSIAGLERRGADGPRRRTVCPLELRRPPRRGVGAAGSGWAGKPMTSLSRLLTLALALLACPAAGAQAVDAERMRIHGSNLLGARLVPALVDVWLKDIGYTQIKHRELGPTRTEIGAVRDGQPLIVEIDKRGTASGLQAIIAGEAEIAMTARQPNAREIKDAWQLGDLTSPAQEWVVGLDGLVLVVAPGNTVSSLGMQQLRDVLGGRTRDWSQLGAPAGPIAVHTLSSVSGTQEAMSRIVLSGGKPGSGLVRHSTHAEVVAAVRRDPRSIGIVGLRAPRGGLRALAIATGGRSFVPDALNVASEDYPLTRRLYFHTGQMSTALGRGFAQWVVSPAGQAAVERSQFASLSTRPHAPGRIDAAPAEYQQLVATARRLPMTLRFSAGLDLFDSRARQDVERLAAYLQRPENAGRRVLLMGFANPQPRSPMQSLFMSQERVDFVSSELLSLNMKVVTVRGFGGRMNLLEASQSAARYRNDRVEVWLR